MDDDQDIEDIITWDLESINLTDLLMVIGSYLFSGNNISSIEDDVLDKFSKLLEEEKHLRETGIPANEVIH
jgi:hypothetical protein|tara:strand:- start:51 stop:263 length:213 start_codon:yes stop_codon:yes gene_type:complete